MPNISGNSTWASGDSITAAKLDNMQSNLSQAQASTSSSTGAANGWLVARTDVTELQFYANNAWRLTYTPITEAVNGSHTLWQRGTGAFTANNAYAADRYQIILAGSDTISVSREGTIKPTNALYSSALTFTLGTGAGASRYKQRFVIADGFHSWLGQVISARLNVRSNAASSVRAVITTDGTGGTSNYSSYHTGGSTFEDLTVSNITIPSDATYVDVGVTLEATAAVYTSNWQVNRGALPGIFQGLAPADELGRAQRYAEVHGGVNSTGPASIDRMYAGNNITYYVAIGFAVHKGGTPTLTLGGTWTVSNCAQPTVAAPSQGGYVLATLASGAGDITCYPDSADDTVTAVWNP